MFKKFFALTMITALLLSSFYTIQLASSPKSGPDLVSAATYVPPTPTPTPTPTPVPTPAPKPVPVPVPVTISWSNAPSAWAKADLLTAEQQGLTLTDLMSQYNKPITRLEFTQLIVNLHQRTKGVVSSPAILAPFTDTTSLDVAKAYHLGLINGVSTTRFNPNGLLTRQEAALVFKREWMALHPTYEIPSIEMAFSDSNKIAAWAKEAARFMVAAGLMKGNDHNQLEPQGNTTREQAMILVLRSFQKPVGITTPDAISSPTRTSNSEEYETDD